MEMSTFEILPVEILHRIFDHLDVQTLLFSVRCVCRRLYSSVNSYQSFRCNFEEISKTKFHLVCQLIPLENVVSLILSDQDQTYGQISFFLSLFNLEQFIRLRSLTLLQIDNDQLNIFLNSIHRTSLTSLVIDVEAFNIRQNTSLSHLSSVIEHITLKNLDLNMRSKDMNELQWPINCTLTYLRIRTSITLNQFSLILQSSPCLKTMVLKDFRLEQTQFDHDRYPQLKSLTCEGGRIQMEKFERCLTLTPALMHLKLVGNGNLFDSAFDGHRWQTLIAQYLPALEKFQFFLSVLTHVNFDTNHVEEIISHYRSPFWIDDKQCSVQCDYIVYLHRLILYSLPICTSRLEYHHSDIQIVSVNNSTVESVDSIVMENVKQLDLNLTKFQWNDEREQRNEFLFRNVTEFRLEIDGKWPKGSMEFLSTTIDLQQISKLFLSVNFWHEYMPSIVHGVQQLLQQAVNIQTLSLFDYCAPGYCTTTMETVCALVTSNIKHLQIRVRNMDDMKYLLDNLTHLISVTFEFAQNLIVNHEELIDCLADVRRYLSRWECQHALHLWLDHH